MLDHLLVSTTGGHVLFYKNYSSSLTNNFTSLSSTFTDANASKVNGSIPNHIQSQINQVLYTHILSGGSLSPSQSTNSHSQSKMSSSVVVDQGKSITCVLDSRLFVLSIHSASITIPYLDQALDQIKSEFTNEFYQGVVSRRDDFLFLNDWKLVVEGRKRKIQDKVHAIFSHLATGLSTSNHNASSGATSKVPRSFQQTQKFSSSLEGGKLSTLLAKNQNGSGIGDVIGKGNQAKVPRTFQGKQKPKKGKQGEGAEQVKKKKEARVWDVGGAAMTGSNTPTTLDFSQDEKSSMEKMDTEIDSETLVGDGFLVQDDGTVTAQDISTLTSNPTQVESTRNNSSVLSNIFSSFSLSTKPLTKQDLDKPLLKIKDHLVGKNVAAPVASHLTSTLESLLLGKTVSKWIGGLDSAINQQLSSSLLKILSPGESTNLLHQIASKRESSNTVDRVFSICFVGVNGVGKSTNLSKIAFWLLQNGYSVLIAACDTFRSGAVEQLQVHERNLNALARSERKVKVFDRGYGKDPAGIAREALNYAKTEGYDVCLIDTAGRMQDNEPLMRALAKLVTVNSPDKIIFVGEALVGNEAVDQLTKFNQALQKFSGVAKPRQIDGIILSKFDTIDDKVGAALSMTFVTGKPILFVGTGQTYTDLRRMNVSTIVSTLLKV